MNFFKEGLEKSCKEKLNFFREKIDKIHTSRISIEKIQRTLDEKKIVSSARITPTNELVIYGFEKQKFNAIKDALLNNKIGYRFNFKKGNDLEMFFNLLPITGEKRKEFIKSVDLIVEEAKIALRLVRKDFFNKIKKEKDLTKKSSYEKEVDKTIKIYQDEIFKFQEKKNKELSG